MLRIAQVTQWFFPAIGGVESHVYELSRRLVRRGHEVTVYTSNAVGESPKSKHCAERRRDWIDGVGIRRFRSLGIIGYAHGNRAMFPSMVPSLIRESPDLVHAHSLGYYPTFASIPPKLIKNRKLVITAHSDPTFGSYKPRLALLPLKLADRVIALTNLERCWLLRNGLADDRVVVIPNGIDLERYGAAEDGRAFKQKHGIEHQLVLYVGRIDIPQKGCDILVKAIPHVLADHPRARFMFVGPDWGARDRLKVLSRSLGADAVFAGAVSPGELLEAYAAADLVVLPSRIEPFGIVLLEAMACGKPIVASRVGGVPEVVNSSNSILVQPGDAQKLAGAINKLLSDETLAAKLGEAGKRLVTRYSWDRVVEEIEHVYLSVFEHHRHNS